jgi:hypothetical protein
MVQIGTPKAFGSDSMISNGYQTGDKVLIDILVDWHKKYVKE